MKEGEIRREEQRTLSRFSRVSTKPVAEVFQWDRFKFVVSFSLAEISKMTVPEALQISEPLDCKRRFDLRKPELKIINKLECHQEWYWWFSRHANKLNYHASRK